MRTLVLEEAPRRSRRRRQAAQPPAAHAVGADSQAALETRDDPARRRTSTGIPSWTWPMSPTRLHVGRRAFRHRRSVLVPVERASGRRRATGCRGPARLRSSVDEQPSDRSSSCSRVRARSIRGWPPISIAAEPIVTRHDRSTAARMLEPHLGFDLRDSPLPAQRHGASRRRRAARHRWAQPALFVVELRARAAVAVVGRPAVRDDRTQRRRVRERRARRSDGVWRMRCG